MVTAGIARIARALKPALGSLAGDRRGSTLMERAVLAGVAVVIGVAAITTVGSGVGGLYAAVAAGTAR